MEGKTHTPGPWELLRGTSGWIEIAAYLGDDHFKHIANISPRDSLGVLEKKDNLLHDAFLIRAAPEMFEALERQVENIKRWIETGEASNPEESRSIYEQMVRAIDRAKDRKQVTSRNC